MPDFYEYWIGRNIDVDELWSHFDRGQGYVEMFSSSNMWFITLRFSKFARTQPIFNFEAVFKTIKSVSHDLKEECLTRNEYESFGPMYVHEVRRESEIWVLVTEQVPALLFLFAIGGAIEAVRRFDNALTSDMQERLTYIAEHFPNAPLEDKLAYSKAWNFWKRKKVLERLVREGLLKVELTDSQDNELIEVP